MIFHLHSGHKQPRELTEFIYREKFGLSPTEFDRLPSKRVEQDLVIMSTLAEYGK